MLNSDWFLGSIVKGSEILRRLYGFEKRLLILTYHRVLPEPDLLLPGEICRDTFEQQIIFLSRYCNVLPLCQAVDRLLHQDLPERAVCVTFDDGYENNYSIAAPVLEKWRVPATVFVATGYIDGGLMWNDVIIETIRRCDRDKIDLNEFGLGLFDLSNDQEKGLSVNKIIDVLKYKPLEQRTQIVFDIAKYVSVTLPNDVMMTSEQLKSIESYNFEVGAHTENHPILSNLDNEAARFEIQNSKQWLQKLLGHEVKCFAFPNGRPGQDYDNNHIEMVRSAGFKVSVTTAPGTATFRSDRYQLPRVAPWSQSMKSFAANIIKNYYKGDPIKLITP